MAGGYKKIGPNDGKKFSSKYQPANRGRKPGMFTRFLKELENEGVEPASKETVTKVFQYMLGLESPEIMKIAGKPTEPNGYPFLMRLIAKELLGGNGLSALREVLDRSNGRSTQHMDVEATGEQKIEVSVKITADDLRSDSIE